MLLADCPKRISSNPNNKNIKNQIIQDEVILSNENDIESNHDLETYDDRAFYAMLLKVIITIYNI